MTQNADESETHNSFQSCSPCQCLTSNVKQDIKFQIGKHQESITGHFFPWQWTRWECEVTKVRCVVTIRTGQQELNILITNLVREKLVNLQFTAQNWNQISYNWFLLCSLVYCAQHGSAGITCLSVRITFLTLCMPQTDYIISDSLC